MSQAESKRSSPEQVRVLVNHVGDLLPATIEGGKVIVQLDPAVTVHPDAQLVSHGPGTAQGEARQGKGIGEYRK